MESSITRPALSEVEAQRRADIEAKIKDGLHSAWIGLRDIRDEKLWRSTHDSFKDYCEQVWGYGKGRGYQMAKAGDVVAGLLEAGADVLPTNEKQARELVGMTPEEAKMVLAVVKQSSPTGKITAAHLKQVGETIKEIVTTKAATDGDGEQYELSDVVKSGIVAETHERMLRQWDHIKENGQKKNLVYVGEEKLGKYGARTFEMLQFLHTLDSSHEYILKAFRIVEEKGDKI